MNDPLFTRLCLTAFCATVLIVALFTLWPELDLLIATALADDGGHFIAQETALPGTLSAYLRRWMEIATLLALLYTAWLWLARSPDRDWRRCWTFLSACLVVAPGIIVNLLLKEHVGRARPAHLSLFGGDKTFTPAFRITDQCASNCSFTSGEAALAATWVFALGCLLWGGLSPRGRGWLLGLGAAFVALVAGLRVVLGRHFPSDVLASILIAGLTALVFYRVMAVRTARHSFAPASLTSRATRLVQKARGIASKTTNRP